MELRALQSRAGLRGGRPGLHHALGLAPHQYGFRSCWVIVRQSWASSLVAAVDAVPGQALGQEGGGKEQPGDGLAQSDHGRLPHPISASAFPLRTQTLTSHVRHPEKPPLYTLELRRQRGAGLNGC